ncbi:MAG: TatD family hydrolase [Bacteroidota bacterium]|nr:TatD family hydrolase [Bacteroidota bacterium]
MLFYDTHTHLYLEEFAVDRQETIQRAVEAGVDKFFLPNIDSTSIEGMLQMEKDFPRRCFPMMGLHPCSVKGNYQTQLKEVKNWLDKHKFYAIGEIGIDLYWDKTFEEEQKTVFKEQIILAKKHKLPIVIHLRNAFDETFEIVEQLNDANLKGIFHCFSGTKEQAEKIISLGGFKLGIGGVVTFKNAGLDKAIMDINPEHLVLETDSPYLAPVPFRGKRNESAYLLLVAQKLAEIYNLPLEKIASITTANANEVFDI